MRTPLPAKDFRWRSSRRATSSAARSHTPAVAECGTPATRCSSAPGLDDTIDEALNYYRTVVGDRTSAELQETYVRGGAALIEYLEADDHFAFKILPWPDYYSSVPVRATTVCAIQSRRGCPTIASDGSRGRSAGRWTMNASARHSPTSSPGAGGLGRFLSAMADNPAVAAYLNTSLVELIVEDGSVTGGVVECEGERRTIRARRGVLLAAGGFEQNAEMRAEYGVPGTASGRWAHPVTPGWRTGPRSPSAQAPT